MLPITAQRATALGEEKYFGATISWWGEHTQYKHGEGQ